MSENEYIEVLLIKPMKKPELVKLEDSLEAMQAVVDGLISEYMPFDDEVALVCNDESKLMQLPPNRAIFDQNGKMQDIVSGTFFLCYAPIGSEKYLSLPEPLREKYEKRFQYPEKFYRTGSGDLLVKRVGTEYREMER